MIEQEKKEELKNENCVSNESLAIESICDKRCKICNSEFIEEIHLLRKNRRQLSEIVAVLLEKYDFVVSEASLSRHFTKYSERQQLISARIMNTEMLEGATKQATHTKEVVALIDIAIEQLKKDAANGHLKFDVSDLDKLMKMRYQVLSGDVDDETDILKQLQKAKVIFSQNQIQMKFD